MSRLLWLALGAFAVGTEGFMIAGLLPRIAGDVGVSIAQAGLLVTIFGITYAIGSPLIAVATSALERKRMLLGALAAFAVANLVAAFSEGFIGLMASRALMALTAGAFMPAANAYAANSVAPERRGRAISMVYTGFTIAIVIGVPIGTAIGNRFGWRMTFESVAVLAAIAWIGIALALRTQAGSAAVSLRQRLAAAQQPGIPAILLLTVVSLLGAFSVFTYLAPLLHAQIGIGTNGVELYLFIFGVGAFTGNFLGGYAADTIAPRRALTWIPLAVMAAFATLALSGHLPQGLAAPVAGVAIFVWGLFGWSFLPIQQARLARAVPALATVMLSLNASAIYVGTAIGATLGGLVVSHGSAADVAWIGFASAVGTFIIGRISTSARRIAKRETGTAGALAAVEFAAE